MPCAKGQLSQLLIGTELKSHLFSFMLHWLKSLTNKEGEETRVLREPPELPAPENATY